MQYFAIHRRHCYKLHAEILYLKYLHRIWQQKINGWKMHSWIKLDFKILWMYIHCKHNIHLCLGYDLKINTSGRPYVIFRALETNFFSIWNVKTHSKRRLILKCTLYLHDFCLLDIVEIVLLYLWSTFYYLLIGHDALLCQTRIGSNSNSLRI